MQNDGKKVNFSKTSLMIVGKLIELAGSKMFKNRIKFSIKKPEKCVENFLQR